MRRCLARISLPLAVAGSLLAAPLPAPAEAPSGHGGARAKPVHAVIVFDKFPKNPFDSRVIWKAFRGQERIERAEWRAGSGFGGPKTKNTCARGRGWLPNGDYGFVQYDNYWGQLIKGRAFFLGSKKCHDGTPRTELFIHTETGDHNHQCPNAKGDQRCRWEWPKVNDYRSGGCIKMSPKGILALTRHYHRYFRPGHRYPARVHVHVRD
jgi:hypothetical protein